MAEGLPVGGIPVLTFTFDPARALRVNECLTAGTSPEPPGTFTWPVDDLIMLAGACHYRLMCKLPLNLARRPNHPDEYVVSVAKAVGQLSAEIHGAIEAASVWMANAAAGHPSWRDRHQIEVQNGRTLIRPCA